jgi:hypothetical protein
MVLPKGTCRDRGENSNAAVARPVNGSGFVALTGPAAVEFSTAKSGARRGDPHYPGENPNVRSKRLA